MMVMASHDDVRASYSRGELLDYYARLNAKGALEQRDSSQQMGERPSALRFSRNRRSQGSVSRTTSENNPLEGNLSPNGSMANGNMFQGDFGAPNSPLAQHPLAGVNGGPQLQFFAQNGKGQVAPGAGAQLLVGHDPVTGNPIFKEPLVVDPVTGWQCTLSQYNAQFQQFQGQQLMAALPPQKGKGLSVDTKGGEKKIDHETAHKNAYKNALGKSDTDGVTLMLKNLPNKYNRQMLVELLMRRYKGQINFLYMPIDFKTDCNCGYCFLNFRTESLAKQFQKEFDGVHTVKCLPGYNSNKVASVTRAAVQGLKSNMDRLKKSPLLVEWRKNDDWQPLLFNEAGQEVAFPCEADPSELNSPQKGKNSRHTAPASPANNSNFTISRSKGGRNSSGKGGMDDTGRISASPSGGKNFDKGGKGFSPGKRAFPHTVGGHEKSPQQGGKKGKQQPQQQSPFDTNGYNGSSMARSTSQQSQGMVMGTLSLNSQMQPTISHQSNFSQLSKGSNFSGFDSQFSAPPPALNIPNGPNAALVQQQAAILASAAGVSLLPQLNSGSASPVTPMNQQTSGQMSPVTNPGSPLSSPSNRLNLQKFTDTGRTDVQKRISANFKEQVLAKDLKALFDTENVKKAEGQQKNDVQHLKGHMSQDGWAPTSELLSLKHVCFPGHAVMLSALAHCDFLELQGEFFRLKDRKAFKAWKKQVDRLG